MARALDLGVVWNSIYGMLKHGCEMVRKGRELYDLVNRARRKTAIPRR
ncbi:MAG: hypothetical protein WKF90_12610 [Pyrinomonadaceae bacterium]